MAQIGSIKVQATSGAIEIPVFEVSDVNYPVLRVETASGVGAINLVDPVDAEIDYVRVQTAGGVKAISTSVLQEFIMDFESGIYNANSYLFSGTATCSQVSSPAAEGSYSMEMELSTGTNTFDRIDWDGVVPSGQYSTVKWDYRWSSPVSGSYSGKYEMRIGTGANGQISRPQIKDNGNVIDGNGDTLISGYNANQWYTFEMRNIDYSAQTFDWYIDGSFIRNKGFETSRNAINFIMFYMYNGDAGTAYTYLDNMQFLP